MYDNSTLERFWSKVNIGNANECWEWLAANTPEGYGRFYFSGRFIGAHRFSWHIHNKQDIPDGLFICHHCDNPGCVNFNHLYPADQKTNLQHMKERGRRIYVGNLGENHGRSKLTDEQVINIRQLYASKNYSQRDLAKLFNVVQGTIGFIVNHKTWRHVQ